MSVRTIAHDCYPGFNNIIHGLRSAAYEHLAGDSLLFRIQVIHLDVPTHVLGYEHLEVGTNGIGDVLYSIVGKVPVLFRQGHAVSVVLEAKVKQGLAVALLETSIDDAG